MVLSLMRDAIYIKMKFDPPPILIDDKELACAIGIGYAIMGGKLPTRQDNLYQLKKEFLEAAALFLDQTDIKNQRLLGMITAYEPSMVFTKDVLNLLYFGYSPNDEKE